MPKTSGGIRPAVPTEEEGAQGGEAEGTPPKRARLDDGPSLPREAAVAAESKASKSVYSFYEDPKLKLKLRLVHPYVFEYRTHAKARWEGRTLAEVFATEFHAHNLSYYRAAVSNGLISLHRRARSKKRPPKKAATTASDDAASPDAKIRNGDLIVHMSHRHEPPVAGGAIEIIADGAELLVVMKPSTIPVHPCGGYHHNSLVEILQHNSETDKRLFVVHRIDRLTSGIVIFGRSAEAAKKFSALIRTNSVHKTYAARVKGRFGDHFPKGREWIAPPIIISSSSSHSSSSSSSGCGGGELSAKTADGQSKEEAEQEGKGKGEGEEVVEMSSLREGGSLSAGRPQPPPMTWSWVAGGVERGKHVDKKGAAAAVGDTVAAAVGDTVAAARGGREAGTQHVHLNAPIECTNLKDGVYAVGEKGKPSETLIQACHYDSVSDTTMVKCFPISGRTHQIRVHLQWLGHPIANDPNYGGELFFGRRSEAPPPPREAAAAAATVVGNTAAEAVGDTAVAQAEDGGDGDGDDDGDDDLTPLPPRREGEGLSDFACRTCSQCRGGIGASMERDIVRAATKSQGIWLHALRYASAVPEEGEDGEGFCFESSLPEWWIEDDATPS